MKAPEVGPVVLRRQLTDAAATIVAALAERPAYDGEGRPVVADGRQGQALDVLDPAVLAPFTDAVEAAILELVLGLDPAGAVATHVQGRIDETMPVTRRSERVREEPRLSQAGAIRDAAVLAWELALDEAVSRVRRRNDEERRIAVNRDMSGMELVGGTIRRPAQLEREAARRKASRDREKREAGSPEGKAALETARAERRTKRAGVRRAFDAARGGSGEPRSGGAREAGHVEGSTREREAPNGAVPPSIAAEASS